MLATRVALAFTIASSPLLGCGSGAHGAETAARCAARTPFLSGQQACNSAEGYVAYEEQAPHVVRVQLDLRYSSLYDIVATCVLVDGKRADAQMFDRHEHRHALALARDIPIPAGAHSIALYYAMVGAPGIPGLPSLPCYSFEVRTSHTLSGEREDATLVARGFEKGDAHTPLEQRPAVEWSEQ